MTQREKTLSVAVAAAGLLWFGNRGFQSYQTALDLNASQQYTAEEALGEANFAVARGRRAQRQLRQWADQSLPTDQRVAESLYQDWLRAQLVGAGMEVTQVLDKSGNRRNPQFGELAADVKAKGTLAQFSDFLYRFYSAPHLHRITSATITPADNGEKVDVLLTVGALILSECKRTNELSTAEPKKLSAPLEEIRHRLVGRNLFVVYKPKSGNSGEAQDAEAAGSYISMIFSDGETLQLAVRHKESGKMAYYHEGDSIQVGRVQGKIVKIESRRAVLETEKGRLEVRVGQNFAEATPETPAA